MKNVDYRMSLIFGILAAGLIEFILLLVWVGSG